MWRPVYRAGYLTCGGGNTNVLLVERQNGMGGCQAVNSGMMYAKLHINRIRVRM